MAKANTDSIVLELPVGSAIFKDGERYEITSKPLSIVFSVGTALKTFSISVGEMLLLKEHPDTEKVTAIRGKYTHKAKIGTTLKFVKLNADLVLKDEQVFVLTQETKVNVPIGTHLSLNGVRFIKNDDNPMYLSCNVEAADLFTAIMQRQ